jgi:D-sedoheptulose 7-phosphate isomerase
VPESFADQLAAHQRVIASLADQIPLIERMADAVLDRLRAGGTVYTLGNGGSAADAQHIAAELVGRFKRDRRGFRAVALTTDTSALTAISNDYGYDRVFTRQVEALVTRGDVVWALSVSGRSPSVLRALEVGKGIGAMRIGFTGAAGGAMKELCDHCLMIDHTSTDRVQEAHLLAYHLVCDRIERQLA